MAARGARAAGGPSADWRSLSPLRRIGGAQHRGVSIRPARSRLPGRTQRGAGDSLWRRGARTYGPASSGIGCAQARRADGGCEVRRIGRPGATQTIPIIVIAPDDPVVLGVAHSIAKPGGNITGTWFDYDALVGKRMEFLKLAMPALARVAVIVNPDDPTDALTIPRLPAATRALGVTLEQFDLPDVTKLDAVAAAIGRADVGALFVGDGPTLLSARAEITAMVARLRLPAMYGFREFAEAGGLMSYGYNLPDAYRQTARLVVRILKGDRPGDLPFELPARYELIVNLKTAKAIGLTIPDSFVLLADEVIE